LTAPMVLQGGPCGRVGRRRTIIVEKPPDGKSRGFFAFRRGERVGFTGVWALLALTDAELAEFGALAEMAVVPAGVEAERVWWRGLAAGELSGRLWEDEGASRLGELFGRWAPDSEEHEGSAARVLEEMGGRPEEQRWAMAAGKAFPFAALGFAVGPDAVLGWPGWFGVFVLDAAGVRRELPAFEAVLGRSGVERGRVVRRVRGWMADLGNDPDFPAGELLDGPLRVLRWAAVNGRGVVGVAPVF
ncbi:hypothetical protein, partial [Kitasatospora sp. NPDC088134]|uniref:hypothetical protein n=1 Tax=Kitasatospora sp. NPDC088134 TaxID=3364071 RepID=UPI00381C15DD